MSGEIKQGDEVKITGNVVWSRRDTTAVQLASGAHVAVLTADLDPAEILTRDVPGPKDERRRGPGRPPKQREPEPTPEPVTP